MKRLFRFMLLLHLAAFLPASAFAQATSETVAPTLADGGAPQSPLAKCLPAGIKPSDVVEATMAGNANGQPVKSRQVTVEQKLKELKATCNREDKLVDGNGRQIVFYHLIGCWGNPPLTIRSFFRNNGVRSKNSSNNIR